MSRTGDDPFIGSGRGPATVSGEEIEKLEKLEAGGQWVHCRNAGFTVHIHQVGSVFGEFGAWIKADDLEEWLKKNGSAM